MHSPSEATLRARRRSLLLKIKNCDKRIKQLSEDSAKLAVELGVVERQLEETKHARRVSVTARLRLRRQSS
jgi:hypothetical protein